MSEAAPPGARRPGRATVIGAGLAGAAVAASLARRGWRVVVLDAESSPAQGASGLPAGLLAPHQSLDDNLLSRLTRAGIACTLATLRSLLPEGDGWAPTGALQNRLDDARPPPTIDEGDMWARPATKEQLLAAGLGETANAWWHAQAAWVRPQALIHALLQHPRIEWRGNARVTRLAPQDETWRVFGESDLELAHSELVVLAAALGTAALSPRALTLHAVRGQVSWSHDVPETTPFPLNGNGHFLPRVTLDGGAAWLTGSTYGRDDTARDERAEDHAANLQRLQLLSPAAANKLAPQFASDAVQAWSGVRCASTDRRPLVGCIAPGLWVSTAMGSRGLTFAILCGELLAARLHGEPLPLDENLSDALDVVRQLA